MPYVTLANGLTLKVPTRGTRSWAETFLEEFAKKISNHDHTGSPKGLPIGANAISANALDDSKVRLRNNQPLRARNAANSADVNVAKVDGSNKLEIGLTSLTDFTTTFSADPDASFTVSSYTARIQIHGKFAFFRVLATGTTSGDVVYVKFTLPESCVPLDQQTLHASVFDSVKSGSSIAGHANVTTDREVFVFLYNNALWSNLDTIQLRVNGWLELA